jgi:hypothetical protein
VAASEAEAEAEAEAERRHHHKNKKSRVKGGRMVGPGHTRCAKEGEMCQCEGQVTYIVDHDDWHVTEPRHNQGVPSFN